MRNWEFNLEEYQKYTKQKFNIYQLNQIRYGLENELDVSKYADLKFKWEQMEEIRWGLENE